MSEELCWRYAYTEITISPVIKRLTSKTKKDWCINNTEQTMTLILQIYKWNVMYSTQIVGSKQEDQKRLCDESFSVSWDNGVGGELYMDKTLWIIEGHLVLSKTSVETFGSHWNVLEIWFCSKYPCLEDVAEFK